MSPGDQLRWLTLWGHRRVQEYMGDEDGVDQVKEEDDGVVALGGGRTRIYKGDVDGVGQVKKEDEGVKLGGGQTRIGIGGVWWFRPQNHRRMVCWFGPQNQAWTVR